MIQTDAATHRGVHLRPVIQLATEGLPQLLLRLRQEKLPFLGQTGWARPNLHPSIPTDRRPFLLRLNVTDGWRLVSQQEMSGQ
jgi:hypothetical protein